MRNKQASNWLFLIPLGIGFLFAALMFYFTVISTEKARNHYRAKKLQEAVQHFGQLDFSPKTPVFPGQTRTPTPTPTPKPKTEKDWREIIDDYEIFLLVMVIAPLLFFGLKFAGLTIGLFELKRKDPLVETILLLRSIFAMLTSFTLSPALFFLYIWALRMGLIR